MHLGSVDERLTPTALLHVRNRVGLEIEVRAVVDSGFNGRLVLSEAVVDGLGLQPSLDVRTTLADGSSRMMDVYLVELSWSGVWTPIYAVRLGDESLIGMKLLEGHELKIAVTPGGSVEITPLPKPIAEAF